MSFLNGHYVAKFDPTTGELPDPGSLRYKMYTHDIGSPSSCSINENRYKLEDFYDTEEDKTYKQIYCWKGIIRQNPDCKIGTVCDPHSYSGARTRFCLTWGCDPHLYVADDSGDPIVNERGGIIVYTKKEECAGSLINQSKCFVSGIRQSMDHILDPENRRALITQMAIISVIVTISLIVILRVRGSKHKKIVKFRKFIAPKFTKTKPLFGKKTR